MSIYSYEAIYGDYRGKSTMRASVDVEDHGGTICLMVEDGDNGGRGAERNWASINLPYEDARELFEILWPILYGEPD